MTAAESPDLIQAAEEYAAADSRARQAAWFRRERTIVEAIVDSVFCSRCDYALAYCTCKGWQSRRGEVEERHRVAVKEGAVLQPKNRNGRAPIGRLGEPPRAERR